MTGRGRTVSWTTKGTASVVSLGPLIACARARHLDVGALLALAELTPKLLDEYDRRIPEAARARIWIAAAEQSRDPLFGLHVAEHSQLGAYDVLDYALYFSATVDEGIRHVVRFHRIISDAWALDVERRGKTERLRRVERTPPPETEAALGTLLLRARSLTNVDIAPIEVRFGHRAEADRGSYEAWFGCPVRFSAPASEIVFHASDLARPVPTGNPGVEKILDRYMVEILDRLPKSASFVELVRATVSRRLRNTVPTLAQTARELHASPRTLQRKLGEHGTSYRALVDSVRHGMADRLLGERRASITEIAFLLGFSDVSSFRRMYKRSTGVSPKTVVSTARSTRRRNG